MDNRITTTTLNATSTLEGGGSGADVIAVVIVRILRVLDEVLALFLFLSVLRPFFDEEARADGPDGM